VLYYPEHFPKDPAREMPGNSKLVIAAGANILVSGTTIFKENNGDIKKNIDSLKLI